MELEIKQNSRISLASARRIKATDPVVMFTKYTRYVVGKRKYWRSIVVVGASYMYHANSLCDTWQFTTTCWWRRWKERTWFSRCLMRHVDCCWRCDRWRVLIVGLIVIIVVTFQAAHAHAEKYSHHVTERSMSALRVCVRLLFRYCFTALSST